MKISTKGRYGLKAMVDLAVNSLGDLVNLKSVAERQNISEKYLEQVFSALRKNGLIKSIKGMQGGYVLAEEPSKITVGAILRALEGDLSVTDERDGADRDIDKLDFCIKANVWEELNKSINTIVDGITLADLAAEYEKLRNETTYMYYI